MLKKLLIVFLFFQITVNAQEVIPGRVVLKFLSNQPKEEILKQLQNDTYLSVLSGFTVFAKYPKHNAPISYKTKEGWVDLSKIFEINFKNTPSEKVISYLKKNYSLEYAEPFYKREFLFTPNDPQLASQYHLSVIKAMQAYDIQQGDTNVVIGISDTGVDLAHPDLKDNIKKNYADPIDGVDNDFDGYIDNFTGWDLAENDNNPQYEAHIHGVHVTGIAAATTNNGVGIGGVGFKCRYLPIKIMNSLGGLTMGDESIVYAADHGCAIVNCSWGGMGYSKYEQDIVNYAALNQNCLVVAAAGNNSNETPYYPASYKNVLSVSATDSVNKKWAGSTYNEYVSVSAPGEKIYSTLSGGTYGLSSGSSMAAPVASGVAALVKAQFPQYGALQILEQLKSTADFIDTVNAPLYAKKIGVGRVNAYRAVTEQPPGIHYNSYQVTDNNDEVFSVGDTLQLSATFINILNNATSASVSLSCSSPYVSILNPTFAVGGWLSNTNKNNASNPFKIFIKNNVPTNYSLLLVFNYNAINYRSYETIEVIVNENILNITVNDVKTSVSSAGYIGFNNPYQSQGLGVIYKGENVLSLGSLILGNSISQVSDNLSGDQPGSFNRDFYNLSRASRVFQNPISNFDAKVSFNDQNAGASKVNVTVNQTNYAWTASPNKKTIFYHYQIINNGLTPLGSLYASLYADWDIKNPSFNKCVYLPTQKLIYAYSTQPGSPLIGIQLLNHQSQTTYYALDLINDNKVNLTDGFSKQEKYTLLTNLKDQAGIGVGSDIATLIGAGPFFLYPNDTVQINFAIIAADSLNELLQLSNTPQQLYNQLFIDANGINDISGNQPLFASPNPAYNYISIQTNNNGTIFIYTADGRLVLKQPVSGEKNLIDLNKINAGNYFIQFISNDSKEIKQTKLVVIPK
ncbi:MAG: S8 family peptidase [Bacteroidia bacterium]|nr:S8 family peptidase [Bacteroidia bacterium]